MKYLITSADRITGAIPDESTANFRVKFAEDFSASCVSLLWADIPSLKNVIPANNTISWTHSVDGALSITVPPGHYSTSTLTSTIKSLMDATAGPTIYTVTYDSNTQLITMSCDVGTMILEFGDAGSMGPALLGFNAVDTANLATHTGTNVSDVSGPKFLYLNVKEFGTHVKSSSSPQGTFVLHLSDSTKEQYNDNYKDIQYCQKIRLTSQGGKGLSISTLDISVHKPDMSLVDFGGQQFSFKIDVCNCVKKPFGCRMCPNCSI